MNSIHNDEERRNPGITAKVGRSSARNVAQSCVFSVMANGFNEAETIVMISVLRQADLCFKSVGPAGGLVGSAYGLRSMPDLILSNLDDLVKTKFVSKMVFRGHEQSLAKLGGDPCIHKFLSQPVAQSEQIAVDAREMHKGRPHA